MFNWRAWSNVRFYYTTSCINIQLYQFTAFTVKIDFQIVG